MWLALALRLALGTPPADSAVLVVRVLDVSDARIGGDAILVTDSVAGHARFALIDASDHGATVVRWLERYGVDTLAAVFLSHPHADHYGGLPDVLRRFPVKAFVYGGTPHTARTYQALLGDVAELHIPVVTADSGTRRITLATAGDTVTFTVLAPPLECRSLASNAGEDVNDCSIGILLTHGAFRMLLPGDAELPEQAAWRTAEPSLLTADVLKAAHHGSSNGTDAAWLDAVHPRAALISANGRQHPFAETLALLAARGVPTYCTADQGTLTVRVAQGAWRVTTERAGVCHARTSVQ